MKKVERMMKQNGGEAEHISFREQRGDHTKQIKDNSEEGERRYDKEGTVN